MEQTTLGETGLRVSRICLGTMTFGSQVDESTADSMLATCLEKGVNFVDTANVYNKGGAETILGRVLRGRRDRVVLASKIGNRMGDEPDQSGLSRAAIVRQIEDSLQRLKTDYLDIYYLHQPDYSTPFEETLEAMSRLVRDGKCRQMGLSNYAAWQVCQMLWMAGMQDLPHVTITQPMYNLLARRIETEFLPMCRAFGLATVVYNPLAGGLLTGKHLAGQRPLSGSRFDGNRVYQQRYWHAENFAATGQLAQAAAREGRSLISLAFAWLLHHTPIDGVIVGASGLEQLNENLGAVSDGRLSEESLETCERVWERLRGTAPPYNR